MLEWARMVRDRIGRCWWLGGGEASFLWSRDLVPPGRLVILILIVIEQPNEPTPPKSFQSSATDRGLRKDCLTTTYLDYDYDYDWD